MKLSKFQYNLPDELIAQRPNENREDARLLVVNRRDGSFEEHTFNDLLHFLDEGDIMVLNNTRVFPARLVGNKERTGARIEVFLLRELNAEHKLWDVLVDPARKIRIGNKLYFGDDESMVAEVIDNTTSRGRTLRFLYDGPHDEFKKALYALGLTPLPPYIKRDPDGDDIEAYQTIFATEEGAVVAPASSLHFSPQLLKRLEIKGVEQAFITVHSGLGTFRAIDVEDLSKHRMDSEQMFATDSLVARVNKAKDDGHRVVAVGTSVLRGISSAVSMGGHMKEYIGWTNKFIFPPYEFLVTDALLTSLHMPYSTTLMMACAFGGYDLMMEAYREAVNRKFRFGVYGDAMLIL